MRILFWVFVLMAIAPFCSVQTEEKQESGNSVRDSAMVMELWNGFVSAFLNKDTGYFRAHSEKTLYCPMCLRPDSFEYMKYFVPLDTFFHHFLMDTVVFSARFHEAFQKKTARLSQKIISGEAQKSEYYEIYLTTTEPGFWGKTHEGQVHYFIFTKVGAQFLFSGLGSIP